MAKRGKHFFAKRIRYRENSLIRPKQNGDRTQGFDTNPIDLELERRITTHAKDDENVGDNQLVRGHKRFNDTVQMVDRDPFYSGYLRTQQATDNDSNVYTDSGRFPVMSLFTKNRLVTEDPEQIEGRESYSGLGVATQTFSGLGEKVMMRKANAGLLFSSLCGTNGWETSASLGNKNFYINMGASKTDGMQLNARDITRSPYRLPVRSLPFGSRLLVMMLLENRTVSGNDEHNQAITDGTTYASRIYNLMRESSIPDSLLNIVPDVMPVYEVIRNTGDKNITELYDWCTSKYASQTLDNLIVRLNKLTFSTTALDSSKKRTCVYEYLKVIVFSVISRLGTGMDRTLSELLPFDVYAAKNLNVSKYRRDYLMEYINGYGDYSNCLYRTYPWEGVFTPTVNQQLFDIIEGWFAGSDGTSLQKLYEIIAPLGGELLNVYLDDLLKRHGHVSGLDTSVYDAMVIGQGYEETVTAFGEYDPTGKMASLLQDGRYIEAVRSAFEILKQLSGGSALLYIVLLIFVGLPLIGMISMYVQTSPRNLDLQLSGLDALIFPYANTSPNVQLSGNNVTTNQFRFSVMANSLNWIGMGATNEILGLIRVISTGLCYVQDALDDGGLKLVGSQGVVTVSPSNPLSTVVNFKGLGEIQTNHLVAKTINCPDHLCGISALFKNEVSNIVEVPVGGVVLAIPHIQFSNIVINTVDGLIHTQTPMTVEVNEETDYRKWEWAGCLPFKMAQYNVTDNNWNYAFNNMYLQGGTYRLMSLLPNDVGTSDEDKFSQGAVLMQKISDATRVVSGNEGSIMCFIPSDKINKIGERIPLYPSSLYRKLLELNDGSLVISLKDSNSNVYDGYVYTISIKDKSDFISEEANLYITPSGYLVIGEFAYSALHIKKKNDSNTIENFFADKEYQMNPFKKNGNWIVDALEFGVYNPVNGKFLSVKNLLVNNDISLWTSLEKTDVIRDSNDHYMMATFEDFVLRHGEGYIYKTTSERKVIRRREPITLYNKNSSGIIVLRELSGVLNAYVSIDSGTTGVYDGQEISLSSMDAYLNGSIALPAGLRHEIFARACYYMKTYAQPYVDKTKVVVVNVAYCTFESDLILPEASVSEYRASAERVMFKPYKTVPNIAFPEKINPTTMTII